MVHIASSIRHGSNRHRTESFWDPDEEWRRSIKHKSAGRKDWSRAEFDEFVILRMPKQIRAAHIVLGRFLKYYASFAMIKEVNEDQFIASNVSEALASPGLQGGINH